MNRLPKLLGTMAGLTLLAGCVTDNRGYDGGYYTNAPRYVATNDYSCDYYNPPWGYPPDYCSYQTWNDPVYYQGTWYSGPIYYRNYAGANWFWLNGDWRQNEWRGPVPSIDWSRNRYWQGERLRARANNDRRPDFERRRQVDDRRDFGNRNDDNDRRGPDDRRFDGRNDNGNRNNGGPGNNFGNRAPANFDRANNNTPVPGGAQQGGRPGPGPGPGPGNVERANNAGPPPDGGRGPRNNVVNNPPQNNGRGAPPPAQPARAERNEAAAKPSGTPQGQGLTGAMSRARAQRTETSASSDDKDR